MKNFDINIPVPFQADKVPEFLKRLPQWLHWVATEEKEDGRFNKVPVNLNGHAINAHDSNNWFSFEDVIKRFDEARHSGLAIDLSGAPLLIDGFEQETFLIGADLDKCVIGTNSDGTPQLTAQAQKIVDFCATYWELSPSGTGIRIFFYANARIPGKNSFGYEIYSSGRFLTVTGVGWGSVRKLDDKEISRVIELMFGPAKNSGQSRGSSGRPFAPSLTPGILSHLYEPQETPQAILAMEQALNAIPPTIDRQTWIRVVLSVKAHGFTCGEAKCRAWSKAAGPYDPDTNRCGYDEEAFNKIWRYPPHSISHRTLYHYSKQFADGKEALVYGDTLNGRRFAALYRDILLYAYGRGKWLRWTGLRWEWCDDSVALEAAKHTAQETLSRAIKEFEAQPHSIESKKSLAHARDAFNLKRLNAMMICGASEPGMHVGEMGLLDADPMMLGCQNGVVDLKTGTLIAAHPDQLITKSVSVNFNTEATCPRWERFLAQITLNDEFTVQYLQKMAGYFLTGKVSEELLHFLFGFGRNGKSVFSNVLTRIWGSYALTAPAEMLMRRDKSASTNDIARLVGVRLLMANETRNGQAFDDLLLKTLVSTERMSARFLYQEYFDFWPTHKILIRGNHKPLISDETEGAWRRIRLVPFELKLDEQHADQQLEESLMQEAEGILAWAVEGCLLWQKEGLNASPRIMSASAGYRKECDLIGEFLEDYVIDPRGQISQQKLWDDWRVWCQGNGVREGSKKAFTRKLEGRGISNYGWKGSIRQYTGIRSRTAEEIFAMNKAA